MTVLQVGPLVRASSATSVVIWVEFSEPCIVTCTLTPMELPGTIVVSHSFSTVTVGDHFYAAAQLQDLQPGTWYTYELMTISYATNKLSQHITNILQCFCTLDQFVIDQESMQKQKPLRLVYGSCRKANLAHTDTLHALGRWLTSSVEHRESQWPHLLLLIGDQIYADQAPDELLKRYPHLEQGAVSFEDFTLFYHYAWTYTTDIRQALAAIPTWMIFDDHEITNNWNTEPGWRARALQMGMEQVLVDGLVAYWVYQGWGNLCQREDSQDLLLSIMQGAAVTGEDALEALRNCIRADVYGTTPLTWHYTIPTQPAIFVANARTERTTVFDDEKAEPSAPTRIIGERQMAELREWLSKQKTNVSLIVSSVPILLPSAISLAEYLMGWRHWQKSPALLRSLGFKLAQLQQYIAHKVSFDHWPLYYATWHELAQLIKDQTRDIVVLSGDVHFSYAMEAHAQRARGKRAHLYQFVSTPIQNALDDASKDKIKVQAYLTRCTCGGLTMRMLPLAKINPAADIQTNLLFQNSLALVTLQPTEQYKYEIQQDYLGIVDGELAVIGRTTL